MSKKDDLKIVFDFIADYLREEQPKAITNKELLIEDKEPKIVIDKEFGDILVKTKTPIDNVCADAAHINHIKQLIERVEAKSVEQATVNNLLANQKREFKQEIKKLKEKVSEELKTEKVNDEIINSSGSTENSISNDFIEGILGKK